MRNIRFSEEEFYHVYNRGVDKREIFRSKDDINRFLLGIEQFNSSKIIGNLSRGHRVSTEPKLVSLVAYCINPNHFHFILEPRTEGGLPKFMHKLGMGYSKYFNTKYKRTGALFQGKFQARHIDSNEYLLHLSAYINLNDVAHGRGHRVSTISKSSWKEYTTEDRDDQICEKSVILDQFESLAAYKEFAENSLETIIKRKEDLDKIEGLEEMLTPSVNISDINHK